MKLHHRILFFSVLASGEKETETKREFAKNTEGFFSIAKVLTLSNVVRASLLLYSDSFVKTSLSSFFWAVKPLSKI